MKHWRLALLGAIALSLLVNTAIYFPLYQSLRAALGLEEAATSAAPRPRESLSVNLLSERDLLRFERQMVESERSHDTRPVVGAARYFGERTQRVERETRRQGSGSVPVEQIGEGGGQEGAESDSLGDAVQDPRSAGFKAARLRDLGLSRGLSPWALTPQKSGLPARERVAGEADRRVGQNKAPVGSHDRVAGAELGVQTLLNTDENRYASYFNRLARELQPRWIDRVRRAASGRTRELERKEYVTELQYTLSSSGEILDVQVVNGSGFSPFDEAALVAMKELRRILNPPRALLRNDGLLSSRLSFSADLSGVPSWIQFSSHPEWLAR